MTTILRTLSIALNNDGTVRGARGEYDEIDATGRASSKGTKRLRETDLASLLPDRATLLISIDTLAAERDDLAGQIEAATSKIKALQEQVAALKISTKA